MEEKQAQRETQPQGPAPRNLFPSDSLLAASYLQIMALSVSSEPKPGFIQEGALSSTQTTMDTAHITRNVCCLSVVSFFFFSLMPSTPVIRDLKLTPFALVCAYRLTPSLKYIGRIYTITANRQALQKHQEVKCIFLYLNRYFLLTATSYLYVE